MTENNTIFAGADEHGATEESGRDKRTVLVAGGLAALVLGAGAFFFLGGSSEEEAGVTITPSASSAANAKARAAAKAAAAAKKAPAAAATKAPAVVPAESTFNVGRNPFAALYVVPVEAPAAPAAAPTTPTTTTPTTGGTTFVPPVTTTTAPKPTTPAVVLHKLVLQTVSEGSGATKTLGTFLIDGKKYVVPVGQVFGPKSELVVVAYQQDAKGKWTAVLRVGDSAPFDALQGEELNVM